VLAAPYRYDIATNLKQGRKSDTMRILKRYRKRTLRLQGPDRRSLIPAGRGIYAI
jgi:hypothetical protein